MGYAIQKKFIKFESGWARGINFNREANLLNDILNQARKENDIQKYIKDNRKWFIPASLFEAYDFGHHEAYIVPEQALGAEYRADYMLVGKNSLGYHIVFVEFEDVNVPFKARWSNMESKYVRNGLTQIRDWKRWMDDNRAYFMNSSGLQAICDNIPTWGIHYCLVVSRRNMMDEKANLIRGQMQYETPELTIVSYDRLVDYVKILSNGF